MPYRRLAAARLATVLALLAVVPPTRAEPPLPLPKDTELSIVGENMSLNGLSLHAYELRSALSVQELMQFYTEQWPGKTRLSRQAPWTILSHPEGEQLVTIQLQPTAGEGSFGYVGISDALRPALRLKTSGFPLAPGAELINDIEARDQGRHSHTVLLRSSGSAEHALSWYERHFSGRGWHRISTERRKDSVPGGQALLMSKGAGELNLVAVRKPGESILVIVLVQPDWKS